MKVTKTIGDKDLALSVYDFGNSNDKVSVINDKIIIKQKDKVIANKLFIDSKSTKKPTSIYHHMICHKTDSTEYTLDSVNGLSLIAENGGSGTQTQFRHMENQTRPKGRTAENSAVYESDPYTEESQSLITGKPQDDGTFECKVFAFKDADYNLQKSKQSKHNDSVKITDHFSDKISNSEGIKNLFNNPDSFSSFISIKNGLEYSIDKTIDWNYTTITIQVGDKPEPPKIGKNNLTLKVYPFKNSDGSLPAL